MLSRIVLHDGRISVDILKKSIIHFKQLRSLELSSVAVFVSDFSLWEVLGTLPCLKDLTLEVIDPASHPAHALENSNRQSGGPEYFDTLETLSVTGSFLFIQHLLDFIDSPCLKSIEVHPIINNVFNGDTHGLDNLITSFMTIVASKWSQSLKILHINLYSGGTVTAHRYSTSKTLSVLADFHEMQNFILNGWQMENMDVRRMVMSWPKLKYLDLSGSGTIISFSILRTIAENCPDLRHLRIRLDTTTNPPFDTSSKSLGHKLNFLLVGESTTETSLECQIRVARHLDLIFPYVEHILMQSRAQDVTWSGIRDLVYLCQEASLRRVK
jgi:hypothetical protein